MKVKCINNKPLKNRTSKPVLPVNEDKHPPLVLGEIYDVKNIHTDAGGFQHWDVGLTSTVDYITSFDTGELLPDGDKIHWCHPSRFEKL